ncbi:MAG: hypothetical protein KAS63_06170 [Candidatus Heimdallarchaeota archaeon]|nr:hypothetical protein [Candidatus Heimdallarchaeota archaeon]MCK4954927.1 hypothetical protein [Candidatus Heimdallarchaeota archaeon]
MNIEEIKGIIEVNGTTFDPKVVLQALLDQGMKIHTVNGSLLIGRTFIDPSPNLHTDSISCPIIDYCKVYEKLNSETSSKKEKTMDEITDFPSLDIFSSLQSEGNRVYVDKIEVNDDDINIQNLSSLFDDPSTAFDKSGFDAKFNTNKRVNSDVNTSEMMGFAPLTRSGSSGIMSSKIPQKLRGECPHCSSTINVNWKYCACCGSLMH